MGVAPQALQIVKLSCFLGKHMDHQAAVVQQNPGAAAVTFPTQGRLTGVIQCLFHGVAQRLDMGAGRTGADQEVISQSFLDII